MEKKKWSLMFLAVFLVLCLFLGVGNLAAQGKGKGKIKNETTWTVTFDAGSVIGLVIAGDCAGTVDGPNLNAVFPKGDPTCAFMGEAFDGSDIFLRPNQLVIKLAGSRMTYNLFFTTDGIKGNPGVYTTDEQPIGGLAGDPFEPTNFVLTINNVRVKLRKLHRPNKGFDDNEINVGRIIFTIDD